MREYPQLKIQFSHIQCSIGPEVPPSEFLSLTVRRGILQEMMVMEL